MPTTYFCTLHMELYKPHADMLLCEPISRSTSEEIFNTIDTYIRTKGLDWHKCIEICMEHVLFAVETVLW